MTAIDDWTVGVPEVDAQHRAILALVEEVRRGVDAKDPAALGRSLSALWDETVGHFATEEALMEEFAYPERNAHRTAHHLFLEDLKALVWEVRQDGLTEEVSVWAVQRIPEWIAFHIETNDQPLGKFVARRKAAGLLAAARGIASPPRSKPARDA